MMSADMSPARRARSSARRQQQAMGLPLPDSTPPPPLARTRPPAPAQVVTPPPALGGARRAQAPPYASEPRVPTWRRTRYDDDELDTSFAATYECEAQEYASSIRGIDREIGYIERRREELERLRNSYADLAYSTRRAASFLDAPSPRYRAADTWDSRLSASASARATAGGRRKATSPRAPPPVPPNSAARYREYRTRLDEEREAAEAEAREADRRAAEEAQAQAQQLQQMQQLQQLQQQREEQQGGEQQGWGDEVQLHGELQAQLREIHDVQSRVDHLRSLLRETENTVRNAQGAVVAARERQGPDDGGDEDDLADEDADEDEDEDDEQLQLQQQQLAGDEEDADDDDLAARTAEILEKSRLRVASAANIRKEVKDVLEYARVAMVEGQTSFVVPLFERLLALTDTELPAVSEGLLRALPEVPAVAPATAAAGAAGGPACVLSAPTPVKRASTSLSPTPTKPKLGPTPSRARPAEVDDAAVLARAQQQQQQQEGYGASLFRRAEAAEAAEIEDGEGVDISKEELDALAREHNGDIISIEIVERRLELHLLSLASAGGPGGRHRALTSRDCESLAAFVIETVEAQTVGDRSLLPAVEAAVRKYEGKDIAQSREALVHDIDDLLYEELIFKRVALKGSSSESSLQQQQQQQPSPQPSQPAASQQRPLPACAVPTSFMPHGGNRMPGSPMHRGDADSEVLSRAATKGSESLPSVSDKESLEEDDGTATGPTSARDDYDADDVESSHEIRIEDLPFLNVGRDARAALAQRYRDEQLASTSKFAAGAAAAAVAAAAATAAGAGDGDILPTSAAHAPLTDQKLKEFKDIVQRELDVLEEMRRMAAEERAVAATASLSKSHPAEEPAPEKAQQQQQQQQPSAPAASAAPTTDALAAPTAEPVAQQSPSSSDAQTAEVAQQQAAAAGEAATAGDAVQGAQESAPAQQQNEAAAGQTEAAPAVAPEATSGSN
eukprot:m51a1_g9520 hypothetical protein (964) ;mRNA; f:753049-756215